MQDMVIAYFIVFLASLLQAATGFGFAIMATPFLLLVYDSRECIQLSILLSFAISILLVPRIWRQADRTLLRRLIIGSAVGTPLGLWLFISMNLDYLKVFISVIVLIVACFSLKKWFESQSETKPAVVQPVRETINAVWQWSAGVCSGILTTSIGMPGVPLALYFSLISIGKETVRSTTLVFFIAVYSLSIFFQTCTVHITVNVLWSAAMLLPAATAGVFCGHWVFPKLKQSVFQLIVNIILLFTALSLLARAL